MDMSTRDKRHISTGKDQCHSEKCKVTYSDREQIMGWAWWLTSVIPALWEAKAGGLLEVKRLRPSWSTR